MFASRSASTYRTLSVQTGVVDASPHRLIEMLLDGALESIARARVAMGKRDVPSRVSAITRALRIVDEGLKAALNPGGGEIAVNLGRIYGYVTVLLTQANNDGDEERLIEAARLLETVREGWRGIAGQVAELPADGR